MRYQIESIMLSTPENTQTLKHEQYTENIMLQVAEKKNPGK